MCIRDSLWKLGGNKDDPTRRRKLYLECERPVNMCVDFYMHQMENETVCPHDGEDFCRFPTRTWYMIYVSFWTLVLIIGIIGNVLVCFAFLQSVMLRKTITNYFVTSLAVSDLLVVLFIVPLKIHFALHNHEFCAPLVFCQTLYTCDFTFFAASITNLFVISIDRYIAIVRPYNYRDYLTPRRAKALIVSIWLYSGCWGLMVHFNPTTMQFLSLIHI